MSDWMMFYCEAPSPERSVDANRPRIEAVNDSPTPRDIGPAVALGPGACDA
jgi:hypothetical protein